MFDINFNFSFGGLLNQIGDFLSDMRKSPKKSISIGGDVAIGDGAEAKAGGTAVGAGAEADEKAVAIGSGIKAGPGSVVIGGNVHIDPTK